MVSTDESHTILRNYFGSEKGNKYRLGTHLTEEHKRKLNERNIGKKTSEETKEKNECFSKGQTKTMEPRREREG
jgi:hypothetical protein